MKAALAILSLCLILICPSISSAREEFQVTDGHSRLITGGGSGAAKTARDTVLIIGPWSSGATVNGQFQNAAGLPAWNGWTHRDVTQPTVNHWQVSDYHADNLGAAPVAGNLAAWCGDLAFPSCNSGDPAGGYGHNWDEKIEWRGTVVDPTSGVNVRFTAYANIDSEPGYDFSFIRYLNQYGEMDAISFDGYLPNQLIDVQFSLEPEDYQGNGANEVVVRVAFLSDGAWSDEDCLYPTAGAIQIDDITVALTQGGEPVVDFTDFTNGLGSWGLVNPDGVGDFTQIWTGLEDVDPCATNYSPQVAFIDDGLVVPGVGPTYCLDWCYGPSGYTVNIDGGRLGPDFSLHNVIESPVMPWPSADLDGAIFEADVYRHENLGSDSAGTFYLWNVRSTASDNPQDIQAESWLDRGFLYYGGPQYYRQSEDVSDLLAAGRTYVQVQLGAYQLNWWWLPDQGTPAPYFDNVRLAAYSHFGPAQTAREIDLAQDSFPASGILDFEDLGSNSVRFDMARNIALDDELRNDPGDSIVVNIKSVRTGAALVGNAQLHFLIHQNPLFNPYRTSAQFGAAASGVAEGRRVPNLESDKWAFDLPDSNFLFPGDVLHYYISATDDDGNGEQTTTLPADLSGFDDFHSPLSYNSSFTVRALPTVYEDVFDPGQMRTPPVLFWNDFADGGGQNEWHGALATLGFAPGYDYDTYYTNGPSSGVGNGLGGRATQATLAGYDDLLYTCGDLSVFTLSNGDFDWDAGNDLALLDSWLRLQNKDILLTGDNLVFDLEANAGDAASQFVADWFKVVNSGNDLRHLIGNQSTPLVRAVPGNGIFYDDTSWIAYGGCSDINTFDAVTADVAHGGIRLAEFTDPSEASGAYNYSAATLYQDVDTRSRVITLPYDFSFVFTPNQGAKDIPSRVRVLYGILGFFEYDVWIEPPTPVPAADKFAMRSYPNPFNPKVKIEYTLPQPGHLSLKVFNLRGQLVRTLIDEHLDTSGSISWDGTDDRGARVGSGAYFAEARAGGQVQVNRLILIK